MRGSPPPQNQAIVTSLPLTVSSTTRLPLVPNYGRVEAIYINLQALNGGGSAGAVQITIQDGDNRAIFSAGAGINSGANMQERNMAALTGLDVPYSNGLVAIITVTGTAPANGSADINIYVRPPGGG